MKGEDMNVVVENFNIKSENNSKPELAKAILISVAKPNAEQASKILCSKRKWSNILSNAQLNNYFGFSLKNYTNVSVKNIYICLKYLSQNKGQGYQSN